MHRNTQALTYICRHMYMHTYTSVHGKCEEENSRKIEGLRMTIVESSVLGRMVRKAFLASRGHAATTKVLHEGRAWGL